jgi:DNA-binding CsgD family transcriptional regulator/tetratricopeptide (TPR) repeat protein
MSAAVVGRDDEVERLLDLVRGAMAGRGAAVLVGGEPGIGKTALLDLVAAEARRLGIRVLRGAGEEWAQRLPFAAIGSCLGFQASDGDRLGRIAALPHGGRDGADQEFIVTEAILDLVRRWCGAGPTALIMDDAQWADGSSQVVLSRLERAIEELPLLVVVARRPMPRGEVADPLLPALDADGAVSLTLGPLPAPGVAALVAHLVGAPPDAGLTDLVAGAGGNPRYVSKLLDALGREGRLQTVAGAARVIESPNVPDSLVEVIRHRLDFLSTRAREVLRVAAVLAPRFTITELSTVLGASVIALWDVVNEALGAGLLADADDELVFQHELIRQALVEDLPPEERRSLRLRAAKALAAAGAPVERVAHHLRAAAVLDAEAVDWLARMADPLTVRAPELAVDLLDRALGQGLMRGDAPRLQLARALLWASRPADAERVVRSALAHGADQPAIGEAGSDVGEAGPGGALRWLLAQACFQQGQLEPAIAAAERTLAGTGVPAATQSRLHGFIGQCLLLLGRVDAADAAATRALPAAAGADTYGTAYGLSVKAAVRLTEQRQDEALELADRAIAALGVQEIQPDLQLAPHAVRGFCLLELDRADEADAAFETGLRQSERGGHAFLTWHYIGRARTRFLTGRWDEAVAEIQAGLEAVDPLGVAPGLQSQAALIAMHRGDFGSYAGLSGKPDTSLGGRYWDVLRVMAQALAWEGRGKPGRALDLLMRHWERDAGTAQPVLVRHLCPDIARLTVTVGASEQARRVAVALDKLAAGHPSPTVRGTAALCRGAADRDADLLLAAAHEYQMAGRPLYEGYAYELASAVFAQRRRTAEAHSALDAALDRYKGLDAGWDSERAAGLLRRSGLRRRRVRQAPRIGWSSLTETERKIAIMVAAGRSGPDIAAELFLSRRTVQGHVSRILAKLGLSSRVELVTAVTDNDNHSV